MQLSSNIWMAHSEVKVQNRVWDWGLKSINTCAICYMKQMLRSCRFSKMPFKILCRSLYYKILRQWFIIRQLVEEWVKLLLVRKGSGSLSFGRRSCCLVRRCWQLTSCRHFSLGNALAWNVVQFWEVIELPSVVDRRQGRHEVENILPFQLVGVLLLLYYSSKRSEVSCLH